MGLNIPNFQALLKEEFTSQRIARITYKKNKLLGLMPKITKFGGSDVKVPLIYGDPQSIGPFSNAQTQKTTTQTKSAAFALKRCKKYGVITIDGETIKASEGDEAAFLEARTTEIDGIFNGASRDLAIDLYRDGTGQCGTIDASTTLASLVIKFTMPSDARNFEADQWINLVDSGAVLSTGGSPYKAQIAKVSTSAGTITLKAQGGNNTTSLLFPGCALGDTIVRDGCYSATGGVGFDGGQTCIDGVSSYIPLADPGATLFYGVDRSINPTRLAGVRYPFTSGEPVESVLIGLSNAISAEGGTPDVVLMGFEQGRKLQQALTAKKTYTTSTIRRMAIMPDGSESVDIGYPGFQVEGPDGDIDVIFDNACPGDRMFMLQMDTWALRSIGEAPGFLDLDDNKMLRESTSDGYEIRIGYYGNTQCNAPGYNGVAQLSV